MEVHSESQINPYIYGQMNCNISAKKIQWRKKITFQGMALEWLDMHMQNHEFKTLLHTILKHELKMNHILKCNIYNYKTLRRKHSNKSSWLELGRGFSEDQKHN